jgi:hypothetical protein
MCLGYLERKLGVFPGVDSVPLKVRSTAAASSHSGSQSLVLSSFAERQNPTKVVRFGATWT